MAQNWRAASDTDRQMLADLLGTPGSGPVSDPPSDSDATAREESLAADLPNLSDLAGDLNPDDFHDGLLDMLDTGEERDPDVFDDSTFHQPGPARPPVPVAAPEDASRIRRFAGVWQGRRRKAAATAPDTSAAEGPTADSLLEGVLANSNAVPLARATLDSLLQPDDPESAAPSADDEAARASLAFALLFSDDANEPAPEASADPLAELLGPDILEADLLDQVLGPADPPRPAAPETPSTPPAPMTASDRVADDDPLDDLELAFDEDINTSDDDWLEDPEDGQVTQAYPEPDDEADASAEQADAAPPPPVVAMREAVGDDLLAELLGEDIGTPVAAATEQAAPLPFPGPVQFRTSEPFSEPKPDPTSPRQPRRAPSQRSGMSELNHVLQVDAARTAPRRKWLVRLIWLLLLGGLLYVAFLPYRFEVGGEFVVQSSNRAEVRARTGGEITTLYAREGDWVEENEIIAVLSNWNQTRDLALVRAEGARLQAQLDTLLAGPRPEEITVAEQALASAELQLATRAQELERQEALFASGTIALKAVEDARNAHELAQSARDQAAAELALVSAGPRETEIDALKATIAGNAEQMAFAELMLEYTNIRAPVSGQIVSSMNDVPIGHSLTAGGLVAEIEDNRIVIVELSIPEITIAEVTVGAPVELRLWSDPTDTLDGTVRSIAPRAEEEDFGRVVRVQVEVPNPDGRLAANITGFGKIVADERPVWQAFSRAIERFFVIELWSWLP